MNQPLQQIIELIEHDEDLYRLMHNDDGTMRPDNAVDLSRIYSAWGGGPSCEFVTGSGWSHILSALWAREDHA